MAEEKRNYSDSAVVLLKANLGYYGEIPAEVDTYLRHLLNYAFDRLAKTAEIHLSVGDLYDDQLQVMYAAWLYRKNSDGAEKPPMLREAIRDYQISKAMSNGQE